MNTIIKSNIIFLFLLVAYLVLANFGLLGISFIYSPTKYSPWCSHLWPRTNYEVVGNSVILHQTTWLDLRLPVTFKSALLELRGENLEQLEIAWKETVEGELLLLSTYSNEGKIAIDLSDVDHLNYLVFSFPEATSPKIDFMKLSFFKPRWFYDFRKNMLK